MQQCKAQWTIHGHTAAGTRRLQTLTVPLSALRRNPPRTESDLCLHYRDHQLFIHRNQSSSSGEGTIDFYTVRQEAERIRENETGSLSPQPLPIQTLFSVCILPLTHRNQRPMNPFNAETTSSPARSKWKWKPLIALPHHGIAASIGTKGNH